MALGEHVVGLQWAAVERSWRPDDAMVYALGVGVGSDDPGIGLEFTTENSRGVVQQVLPTYAVLICNVRPVRTMVDVDPASIVHAGQAVTLHQPLPVEGTVWVSTRITGLEDKGTGALLTYESTAVDEHHKTVATATSSAFIKGEGGFGGRREPRALWEPPQNDPDHVVRFQTLPNQALLYRLSGDRNPLHSDPTFAQEAGFDRPILHGLATYGFTGRALVEELCASDVGAFGSMSGRFSRPAYPGEQLIVSIWRDRHDPRQALFQTRTAEGRVVLDHGRFQFK